MRWPCTSDERRRWHYRRAAKPRCSDRDSAVLEARNLSEHWTSRVAERIEWRRSRLQSAIEVFKNDMRYINSRLTYLLTCKDHAKHFQAAAAHDAWQLSRLGSMPSPPPAVCKNFTRLITMYSFSLFRLAHFCMLASSTWREATLEAGIIRYVSSANFQKQPLRDLVL